MQASNEIIRFVLGVLAGAGIVLAGDFFLRNWKTRSYIRQVEKSPNRYDLDQELRELLAEENEKEMIRARGVHPTGRVSKNANIQHLDVDVLAAVYKRRLKQNGKKTNPKDHYQIQPPNSASWGSD